MELIYSDGRHFGQEFVYKGNIFSIQGNSKVRETSTVSGRSVTFSKAYVRLRTVGSPANVLPDGYIKYTTNGNSWLGYGGSHTDFDLQSCVVP